MSTVGVFLLLLAAFVLLGRLYIRPQRRARRAAATRNAAIAQAPARREREPRDNPGDPGREPDATASGHGTAGSSSTGGGGMAGGGGAAGGAGASGSIGDGGAGDGD